MAKQTQSSSNIPKNDHFTMFLNGRAGKLNVVRSFLPNSLLLDHIVIFFKISFFFRNSSGLALALGITPKGTLARGFVQRNQQTPRSKAKGTEDNDLTDSTSSELPELKMDLSSPSVLEV